jgi:hypothetical protein
MQRDLLQLARTFRIPAACCALALLLCEAVSRPFAGMWIDDDGSYVRIAQHLAATGHIVYNGWPTAMLGWQLYLGAAFIKLFGFSYTAVRMSTLIISLLTAFLLQRTLVRAGVHDRNATLGTLALVLSPIYLMLSVTFMTDITGLFAIVLCLYSCLRALQAGTTRASSAWLCFAAVSNAICGSSRQIAWLGVLVMVPSTLWLLRRQRRVWLAGALATLAGGLFVFGCMYWFQRQPYSLPEKILIHPFPLEHAALQLIRALLDVPFLVLPITAIFLPGLRRSGRLVCASVWGLAVVYTLPDLLLGRHTTWLEPTLGQFVNAHGFFDGLGIQGTMPVFLPRSVRVFFTLVSVGGSLGLLALLASPFTRSGGRAPASPGCAAVSAPTASWKQLGVLLGPFTAAYLVLLIPRAADELFDRYLLALLVVALLVMLRCYQERVQPRLPATAAVLVALMGIYAIAATHNMFAFYRARTLLASELTAAGVPLISVDNGWESNFDLQIQRAGYINDARIVLPANAFKPVPPPPAATCRAFLYERSPVVQPLYGISFDPRACYGPAPFAPVTYSRWLTSKPGTLYVIKYVK